MLSPGRLVAGVLAAGLVIVSAFLLDNHTSAATGAGATDTATDTPTDIVMESSWDGATTHMAWDGTKYTTVEASFVGDRVAAPGDRVQRTLDVVNNGPSGAYMTVSLAVSQSVPPQAPNTSLANDVSLFWDVAGNKGQAKFADLLKSPDGVTMVTTGVPVVQGATSPVTVGFAVSPGLTADKGGTASTVLSFDVLVQLQGDPDVLPGPSPAPMPTPTPTPGSPPTAATGGSVVERSSLLVVLLMAGAVLLAFVPRVPTRRDATDQRRAA